MRSAINLEALVCKRIQENLDLNRAMPNDVAFRQLLAEADAALMQVPKEEKKVLFFWSRGSADAQHLAAELTGRFQVERPALPGLALTVNAASMTAIANDYSFEQVYVR